MEAFKNKTAKEYLNSVKKSSRLFKALEEFDKGKNTFKLGNDNIVILKKESY